MHQQGWTHVRSILLGSSGSSSGFRGRPGETITLLPGALEDSRTIRGGEGQAALELQKGFAVPAVAGPLACAFDCRPVSSPAIRGTG